LIIAVSDDSNMRSLRERLKDFWTASTPNRSLNLPNYMDGDRRKFVPEEREKIARGFTASGKTQRDYAREFGISDRSLREWLGT
jgi:hypothetical protein